MKHAVLMGMAVALVAFSAVGETAGEWHAKLDALGKKEAGWQETYAKAARALYKNPEASLLEALGKKLTEAGGEIVVGPKKSIGYSNPLGLLLVHYQARQAVRTPVDKVKPAKSGALFPGGVSKEAKRATVSLVLQPTLSGWQSTGLYAPPGECVTITVSGLPKDARLGGQIGCHTDTLSPQIKEGKDQRTLRRWPVAVRRFSFKNGNNTAAYALGGLLYFTLDGKLTPKDRITVCVSGCVEAPFFKVGRDTAEAWEKTLSQRPAPWAEIDTGFVILTMPSWVIRKHCKMPELCDWWQKSFAMMRQLSGRGPNPGRPERLVDDTQISAGGGHSGYPVMHMSWSKGLVDVASLKNGGTWGGLHELGHNLGQGANKAFSLSGNGEVICNVYGCYVVNVLNKKPLRSIRPEGWRGAERKMRAGEKRLWSRGTHFERLCFYLIIAEKFGWNVFIQAVNDKSKVPAKSSCDKMCALFSKAAKSDLAPYFAQWGLEPSAECKAFTGQWPASPVLPWPIGE